MRGLICCLIAFLSLIEASASKYHGLDPIKLYGNDYVSLEGWAKSHEMNFNATDKVAVVTNHFAKIEFTANARKITLNKVTLWLSKPVAQQGEDFYISPLDLQKTLNPILYPPKEEKKIHTIWIDAGHGGRDPGNLEKRKQEKHYTLLLAKKLRDILKKEGFRVLMSRTGDDFVHLTERAPAANKNDADLFVSLHYNSAADPAAQGIETFCLTPADALSTNMRPDPGGRKPAPGNKNDQNNIVLAYQVQKALTRNLDVNDRGVQRARFVVLKETDMPAILIEGGFMSNPGEQNRIEDPDFRNKMASSIAIGIMAYKRVMERP